MKATEIAKWWDFNPHPDWDGTTEDEAILERIQANWPDENSNLAYVDWSPLGRMLQGIGFQIESDASFDTILRKLGCKPR